MLSSKLVSKLLPITIDTIGLIGYHYMVKYKYHKDEYTEKYRNSVYVEYIWNRSNIKITENDNVDEFINLLEELEILTYTNAKACICRETLSRGYYDEVSIVDKPEIINIALSVTREIIKCFFNGEMLSEEEISKLY